VRVRFRAAAIALVAATAACGPPPALKLPTGASTPLTDVQPIVQDALGHCAGLHSITAELALSGRAGSTKLRGRLQAGFSSPDKLRLEAVAPFGAPFFIVAGSGDRTTLWLPRDARVLRDAPATQIVDALAGFAASPGDLAAWLEGCPAASFAPAGGQSFGSDWAQITGGDRTAWFRKTDRWRLMQSERDGLAVEFADQVGTQPGRIRLQRAAGSNRGALDVRLSISQVETNVTLGDEAFAVDVPKDAAPITIEELRQSGPLRDTGGSPSQP
jgi:outer membrane lipoprotein-sorting protein